MVKYLVIALIIIAAFFGFFYYVSGKKADFFSPSTNKTGQVMRKVTPAATANKPAALDTTDQSIDGDVTALDKDLSELNDLDSTFAADLNNL